MGADGRFLEKFGVERAIEAFCNSSSAGKAPSDGFEEVRLRRDVLWLRT